MPTPATPRDRRAATAERTPGTPARTRTGPRWRLPAASAILLVAILAGGAGAAAASAAPSGTLHPPSGSSWAWGAEAAVSLSVHEVGAYNSSVLGGNGNLTVAGAYVDLSASIAARQASYAIVVASNPSPGNVSLQVSEAQFQGISLNESVQGALPVAGNYSANASIPLANQSAAVSISEQVLDVASAFLNYTVTGNGSVALTNEHLEYARYVNVSLDARHFPNVTVNALGGPDIRYNSGAINARGLEVLNLTGSFSPGLLLVQRPLSNSSHWTEVVKASWNGTVAYASSVSVNVPGGPHGKVKQGASAQFARSAPLNLSASANGTRSVLNPNGTRTTETVIDYTLSAPGGGAQVVDGLFIVPSTNSTVTSTGLVNLIPERPATSALASTAGPRTSALVPASGGLPTGSIATTQTGGSVVASPMSPDNARSAMQQLETSAASPADATSASGSLLLALICGVAVVGVGAVLVRRELRRP